MNFVRFSGELAIYYVLIAPAAASHLLYDDDVPGHRDDAGWFVGPWLIRAGRRSRHHQILAGGGEQSVIENMAPVLTRLFTPLFWRCSWCFWPDGVDRQRNIISARC
jgi:hypothetical protein